MNKLQPQALECETAVLGAIMLEKTAFERVSEYLAPESFYSIKHQKIYKAFTDLAGRSQPIDIITVNEQLKNNNDLELIGGTYEVVKLTNNVVSSANIESHAKIIAEKSMLRDLITLSSNVINEAMLQDADPFTILETTEKTILKISNGSTKSEFVSIQNVISQALNKIQEWKKQPNGITGVATGFGELDRATRGWQAGDLIIIAARPSVGKTAFALNLIRNAAESGIAVGVWSLEMKAVFLALRMMAAESDVMLHKLQTGRLSELDESNLMGASSILSRKKIFFDDNTTLNIRSLKSKARRLKKRENIGLLVIDYLQLMQGEGSKSNREQEIATISRELKNLAQELEIPIIALSQLSRDGVKSASWEVPPPVSALRESGAIEQDADLILMLWAATESEMSNDMSLEAKRKIRIMKQRNGMLLTIELDFKNEIQLFKSIEQNNDMMF